VLDGVIVPSSSTQFVSDVLLAISVYRIKNARVNWNTWRQFNSTEDDIKARKSVFDEFIAKTHFIAPTIEKRFNIRRNLFSWFSKKDNPLVKNSYRSNLDPLSSYLESEQVTYSQLKGLVTKMGEGARLPFAHSLSLASQIIGRTPEYYDDFYYFRNRILETWKNSLRKLTQ
jgi:hypothetical protein